MSVLPGDKKLPVQPYFVEELPPDQERNLRWMWEEIARFINNNAIGAGYVPGGIEIFGYAIGLRICSGAFAKEFNSGISKAEFRAYFVASGETFPEYVDMRTASEGGTFEHDGTTKLQIEDIFADEEGAAYSFVSAAQGRWYIAWRLFDSVEGWSDWSDGNENPAKVQHYVDTGDPTLVDTGPPANWEVVVKQGTALTFLVEATRPATNGNRIVGAVFQYKDSSTGSWRDIDADAGPAVVRYDGSAINHTYDPVACTITKPSGDYGDAATLGGLLLVDVRASNFDNKYVDRWVFLEASDISGTTISGVKDLHLQITPNAEGNYENVRVKIVTPLSEWDTEGYFAEKGAEALIYWNRVEGGDIASEVFRSRAFAIPAGVTVSNLEARVFFMNDYSVSDDDTTGSYSSEGDDPSGGGGEIGPRSWDDFDNPGIWERRLHPYWAVSLNNNCCYVYQTNNNQLANNCMVSGAALPMGGLMFKGWVIPDQSGHMSFETTFRILGGDDMGGTARRCFAGVGVFAVGSYSDIPYQIFGWGFDNDNNNLHPLGFYTAGTLDHSVVASHLGVGSGNFNASLLLGARLEHHNPIGNNQCYDPKDTANWFRWNGWYTYDFANNQANFNEATLSGPPATPGSWVHGFRFALFAICNWQCNNFVAEFTHFEVKQGITFLPMAGNWTIVNNPAPPPQPTGPGGVRIFSVRT
jgi:hypothetical protein